MSCMPCSSNRLLPFKTSAGVGSGRFAPGCTIQIFSINSPTNIRPSGRNANVVADTISGTTTSFTKTGLKSVSVTGAEVARLPAASIATAVSVWTPLLAILEFQRRL